jgi:alpha-tubulin suppressor-like RCC1 family protein
MPKSISYFLENHIKVIKIEAGEANSAVITNKNTVLIWGVGLNGRLGTGKT